MFVERIDRSGPDSPVKEQGSRIHGSGEMAERIRQHPWEVTTLGPIGSWSSELVMAVNMMLSSKVVTTLLWGPDQILIYNDEYRPHLGAKHPALGQTLWQTWAEFYEQLEPLFRLPYQTGEATVVHQLPLQMEFDGKKVDRTYTLNINPVWGETVDGVQVVGLYQTTTDETEGIQATRKLRASEERAKRVLNSIGDAVIVTDRTQCITGMNPVAAKLSGWSESDAIGNPLSLIFNVVHESTREQAESPADKVIRVGGVAELASHTVLISKDGTETHIDHSGAPILDEDGQMTGIVLVFRDIEERRQAERTREVLADRLERILLSTTDGVILIDRDWNFLFLNKRSQEVTQTTGIDMVGKNAWECFPAMVYEGSPYLYHYHRAMDEGVSTDFVTEYPEPLNVVVHVFARPMREGILVIFRDITEERQRAAALIQSEKLAAVVRLSAAIAHEINNPLESVTNLLYLAKSEPGLTEEAREYLDTADAELRRASAITNETLRFHKHRLIRSRPTAMI